MKKSILQPLPIQVQGELLPPQDKTPQINRPSNYKDRILLNKLLKDWSHVSGIDLKELKARLRSHAAVPRIDYMSYPQVLDACEWINSEIQKITPVAEGKVENDSAPEMEQQDNFEKIRQLEDEKAATIERLRNRRAWPYHLAGLVAAGCLLAAIGNMVNRGIRSFDLPLWAVGSICAVIAYKGYQKERSLQQTIESLNERIRGMHKKGN